MIDIRLNLSKTALPLHQQITDQIAWLISQGKLAPTTRLPASRSLAQQLGISRGCVIQAYETLVQRELCSSATGRGTFVASDSWPSSAPPHSSTHARGLSGSNDYVEPGGLSLMPSLANTEHLPISEFRKSFGRTLRYPGRFSQFGESAGDLDLRRIICEKLLPERGIKATPAQVLVVPGSQYASLLLAMTLQNTYRTLHAGVPGYLDIATNFARFGYQLSAHKVDAGGISDLPSQAADEDIFYVMPEHHFPQCVSMSMERRQQLLALANASRALIIEDDYDSEFYYDRMPLPALKSSDTNERVIYLGTFSKSLFNSLRLGYVVAGEALITRLSALHWSLSRGTSSILQRWVYEMIQDETYDRHIRRMRSVYRTKRDSTVDLITKHFPHVKIKAPSGGLQIFVPMPSRAIMRLSRRWCRGRGIITANPDIYVLDPMRSEPFLILGFSNVTTAELDAMLSDYKRFINA